MQAQSTTETATQVDLTSPHNDDGYTQHDDTTTTTITTSQSLQSTIVKTKCDGPAATVLLVRQFTITKEQLFEVQLDVLNCTDQLVRKYQFLTS